MDRFSVQTKKLLIVAGIVWLAAGINIANIGVHAFMNEHGWIVAVLAVGSVVVFSLFHIKIFVKMVRKHADRILGYVQDRMFVLRFFDAKGYVMMAIMMGGGISLRMLGVLPDWFVSLFYTGIGAALIVAGGTFLLRYAKGSAACPVLPRTYR